MQTSENESILFAFGFNTCASDLQIRTCCKLGLCHNHNSIGVLGTDLERTKWCYFLYLYFVETLGSIFIFF